MSYRELVGLVLGQLSFYLFTSVARISAAGVCTKSPHLYCRSLYSLVYMPQLTPVGHGYTRPNFSPDYGPI
jgi:hypothetical protein